MSAGIKLNNRQRQLLSNLNLPVELSSDTPNSEFIEVLERLQEEIQLHGFDASYKLNEHGKLCEEVLSLMGV